MASDAPIHEISLAVWDVPSPLVMGHRSKMKVGAACSAGCQLTGDDIEICDERGVKVGMAKLGQSAWTGTSSLYWAEVDVVAPATQGTNSWSGRLMPSNLQTQHATASSCFSFITVAPPEHHVMVRVVEKSTKASIDSAELRLGVYRGCTTDSGVANMEVSKGTYDLVVCKPGYEVVAKPIVLTSDVSVEIEIETALEAEHPYWMG